MKKIILLVAFTLLLAFSGCQSQSEKEYINSLRTLEFNGDTVLYAKNVEILSRNIMTLMNQGARISEKDIKWEFGEKLDDGRMVIAEYHGDKIFYFTYERDGSFGVKFSRSYSRSKFGIESPVSAIISFENEFMKKMLDY